MEGAAIRVLVADDHRVVRTGIRGLLSMSSVPVRCMVDEAGTSQEAIRQAGRTEYDVILMDYDFPDLGGARTTQLILQMKPKACILALSVYGDRSSVRQMVQAGARGYMLKNVEPDVLVFAFRTVMGGTRYYSNEVALSFMGGGLAGQEAGPLDQLTTREKEVFRQILAGLPDREIAQRLFVSKRTVDKHRQNLMRKLGVHNAVELVQAAGMMGR